MKVEDLIKTLKEHKGKDVVIEAGFNRFSVGKIEDCGHELKLKLGGNLERWWE